MTEASILILIANHIDELYAEFKKQALAGKWSEALSTLIVVRHEIETLIAALPSPTPVV